MKERRPRLSPPGIRSRRTRAARSLVRTSSSSRAPPNARGSRASAPIARSPRRRRSLRSSTADASRSSGKTLWRGSSPASRNPPRGASRRARSSRTWNATSRSRLRPLTADRLCREPRPEPTAGSFLSADHLVQRPGPVESRDVHRQLGSRPDRPAKSSKGRRLPLHEDRARRARLRHRHRDRDGASRVRRSDRQRDQHGDRRSPE